LSSHDPHDPIIVSGMARSGTTWMQWFLSQHPRIHVHGQPPNLPWNAFWKWYQTLMEHSAWSVKGNRHHGYEIAHYAGSPPERCRAVFKRMFREYLTGHGPDRPRWGLKWLDLCANPKMVGQFESLWPQTCWIVCLRDPFVSLSSQKNTFVPSVDLHKYAAGWVRTCEFVKSYDPRRVVAVQIDKLDKQTPDARQAALECVLACLGEEPSQETEEFLRRWPLVHKVIPDQQRRFVLSDEQKRSLLDEVPQLAACMEEMGYLPGSLRGPAS